LQRVNKIINEIAFEYEDSNSKTFFSELISSISDANFSKDGDYIISRDFMTLKIWDVRKENEPVNVHMVHEPLRSKLCDLYENDCIFDKFECSFSHDGKHVVTGSYKNNFNIFETTGKYKIQIEATRTKKKSLKKLTKKTNDYDISDFKKKCLYLSMHPNEDIVSISAINNLYIFASQDVIQQQENN
jgi:serine/threonine-protein phosphatase 2A regulatory subunit B